MQVIVWRSEENDNHFYHPVDQRLGEASQAQHTLHLQLVYLYRKIQDPIYSPLVLLTSRYWICTQVGNYWGMSGVIVY